MNDANKFVNAYIDFAVSQLHENINTILQLKAQLKVANELVSEKDAAIGKLMQDLETNKASNEEMVKLRDQARKWEDSYNSVSSKVTHLDTALSQIAQMKKEVVDRDQTIAQLQEEINLLKNPPSKKAINSKVKKEVVKEEAGKVNPEPVIEPNATLPIEVPEKKPTDDF